MLLVLFVVFGILRVVSQDEVESWIEPLGNWGAPVFAVVSALLGCILVPGPLLAAASGLLFGTWLGFAVTLTSSVLAALIGWEIGRRTGAIEGPHRAFLERRGLWAVIVQRLLPGIPDAPLNYVAGAIGVKPWDLALGTAIGVAPRAFAYTALGDAIGDRSTAQLVASLVAARPHGAPRAGRGEAHPKLTPPMLIAIDGPAGAGKSTVARAVARALGFEFLDSGAMYRAAALAALRGDDPTRVRVTLGERVLLGDEDVTDEIRTPEVTDMASKVSADPAVREALVDRQREIIAAGDHVAEGRDIGTVVWPQAELKVFLTATPEERARRRAEQLGADYGSILVEQRIRDERDRSREHSPLLPAQDAVELDTTGLSLDEVVERIVELAR